MRSREGRRDISLGTSATGSPELERVSTKRIGNEVDKGATGVLVPGRAAGGGRCGWRQQGRKAPPHKEEEISREAKHYHLCCG